MRHRDVQRGTLRAAVFGMSDGLTTNVALILGVAAATRAASFVRLAGLAGLLAGAFSMAAGEYLSMRAQAELLQFELHREAGELRTRPDYEHAELAALYRRRGLSADLADTVATALMREPTQARETHAREELNIRPDQLGSPVGAALWSFGSFAVGALLPLLPWLWVGGSVAILTSVLVGAAAALAVGAVVGLATGQAPARTAGRQLALTAAAASVTFLVGRAVGVSAT